MRRTSFWLPLFLPVLACAPGEERAEAGTTTTGDARPAADGIAGPATHGRAGPIAADDVNAFDSTTAVLLLADSAHLEGIRAQYGEEEYAVVADDMMWYRAEAITWLEDRGIALTVIEGRPDVRFRVAGVMRPFDLQGNPTADVVVLYERDREPIALAPIDVSTEAADYFTTLDP